MNTLHIQWWRVTFFSVPLRQVEGDTVTFSFEMRSGREHNTPDKAMWGFSCTVRAQVKCWEMENVTVECGEP